MYVLYLLSLFNKLERVQSPINATTINQKTPYQLLPRAR